MSQFSSNEGRNAPDGDAVDVLRQILRWVKVASRGQVKLTLEDVFRKEEGSGEPLNDSVRRDVMLYELADGTRPQKEVASIVGLSPASVSMKLTRWEKLGLVEERTAVFDLLDFGYPDLRPAQKPDSEATTPASPAAEETNDGC